MAFDNGARRDDCTVLCVAALKRRKGQQLLLGAIKRLIPRFPAIRLMLVGDTRYTDQLRLIRELIQKLQLQSRVNILGSVGEQQLEELYRSATIFALPSVRDDWHFEGYGLAMLEAASAGLPVIGMRGTVAEELIQHDKSGLLVDQKCPEEGLASAISRLLEAPDLRTQYAAAARRNALSRTWKDVATEHLAIYTQSALRPAA